MGYAAKIIQPEPEEQFREMIHDEVDKWVDKIIDKRRQANDHHGDE